MTPNRTTDGIGRRSFLKQAGLVAAAVSSDARSYARILGANDRIRLGQIGCGERSRGHVHMVQLASRRLPVETVAVCDLWSHARERRAEQVRALFRLEPQIYKYSEDMLGRKDIDGVMIATADFQHALLCKEVVEAGKDCYVEKPFGNVLSEVKEARKAVRASKQVVQMGSQHRSQPYQLAVRDLIRSNRIGKIVSIEQEWNVNEERWRFTPNDTGRTAEMMQDTNMRWKQWLYDRPSELREEDTDWNRWLLGKPHQPFDPHIYLEFRLYKKFSSGIFDQWMSHGSDLVHLWTDEVCPESVSANGGIFAWPDGRENPDTCIASVIYPKGFLYTFRTTMGNSYRSFSRIQGRTGTIANYGGEGASFFVVSREGGQHERQGVNYASLPITSPAEDAEQILRVHGAPPPDSHGPDDDDADHLLNWLEAMRDRKDPNATVDHGFSHSVAVIMAAQSYWTNRKVYWNSTEETIVDTPVPRA